MPARRLGHRLGHAGQQRLVSPRGGDAAQGCLHFSCSRRVAGPQPKLEVLAEPDEPDAVVLARVVDYYHATLKESPEALGYLEKRGLQHPELVDHFKLGYANRTLGYRLPIGLVAAGAALRGQLQRIGLYRASGHEHLSGSLTIPVIDEAGPRALRPQAPR